jgi:hypothetical protein
LDANVISYLFYVIFGFIKIKKMKEKDDLSPVVVFAGTQWEAAFVKSMLEDNEIDAFLKDEIFGTLEPWSVSPGGFGPVKVIVPVHDEERAKKVVEEYILNKSKSGDDLII